MSDSGDSTIPAHPPESSAGEPTLAVERGERASRGVEHPQRVGRYQVISVLGEGGMGVVYQAQQTHPVRRTVALKLIKLGLDTRQVVSRFDGERQALAMMDHPNVARVFDAGADDLGRPYFVMEYVPGAAITRYCDEKRLTTRQRLELFCQACAAVQHAHQKGIIHRDLKPGNLLVHEMDGQPVVKVIDFGLAKAITEKLSDNPQATERGQLLGTPEYMSPEQAGGDAVDTRTDVYALGVILYELVTGTLPFDAGRLRGGTYLELHRLIRETEPLRPSLRLTRDTSHATIAAKARSTEPQTLVRTLRNDLDWIVMRAMEKDPERRYSSVSELAADIGRFLRHEPVSAGPPTASYRLRKFIRRHRLAVVASSALAAALLLGAAGMTWQAIRATRAERAARSAQTIAEERRIIAETNAATVTAVNDFLTRMLGSADPAWALGKETTVREILEITAVRIKDELRDQPAVEAKLRLTIGRTYRSLGRADEALPHLQRALELASAQGGEDSEDALLALDHIGNILSERGRFAEAEPVLRRQIELARRRLGPEAAPVLYAMNSLAACLQSQDRFADAEPIYREVIAGMRKTLGPEHSDIPLIESNLAFLIAQRGRLAEAEAMLRPALEAQRRLHGPDHPRTMMTQSNLALMLENLGRVDEAAELYRDSLERSRRVNGAEHPSTFLLMSNLGNALRLQASAGKTGAAAEAETLLRSALDGQTRLLGDQSDTSLEARHKLSLLLLAGGRRDEALELARKAFEIVRDKVPAKTATSLRVRLRYASILVQLERYAQAEPVARDALVLAEQMLKPTSRLLSDIKIALAASLEGLGRAEEAAQIRVTIPTTAPATAPTAPAAPTASRAGT